MNQPTRNVGTVVAVLVVLVAGVWWSRAGKAAPAGRLLVSGDVRADIRSVSAPALVYPTPDYAIGIPKTASSVSGGMGGSSQKRGGSSSARTGQPAVAGMLKRVLVREGDRVVAGQLVAEFDTAMLDLGVEQAQAAARKAREDVSVMNGSIDKLTTANRKLSSARAKIATAKSSLLAARAALRKARKQLLAQKRKLLAAKSQRSQLAAALAAAKAQAATFPPGQVPPALKKQIGELTGMLAAIDPGLAGIAKGLRTVDTNLAKVSRGLAALPKASAQISSAAAKLADAKVQLRNAKDVLGIVADGQDIAIQLAKVRRLQAFVRSPLDGVVMFARHGGTVAMVSAPLVRIRADGPQRVDTYLTAEQAASVGMGSAADITFDSVPGTVLRGRISEIGSAYVFPPTSFPTQVVHMTRALKVTIRLDEGVVAPPGTPVDISLHTNTNR